MRVERPGLNQSVVLSKAEAKHFMAPLYYDVCRSPRVLKKEIKCRWRPVVTKVSEL